VKLAGTAIGTGFFALAALVACSAAAQVRLGSPGDPPRVALTGGAFDVKPDASQATSRTAALVGGEYRFGDQLWFLAPFIGASGTGAGAFYGYFGLGFDVDFGPHWVLTPNAAAGYFTRGGGTDLGSWWEFRTGAELDYRFADLSRLGIAVHHTSNAGLTRRNPGEESVTLVYTVPIR
jgi:lipid A 3-O-deacylase